MPDSELILTSTITCPRCGAATVATMPVDACLFFYDCPACGARLRPKPGDCCVFCSYGDVPCPPRQAAARRGDGALACVADGWQQARRLRQKKPRQRGTGRGGCVWGRKYARLCSSDLVILSKIKKRSSAL